MQILEAFQSLWAMTQRPRQGAEMPLTEMMSKIAAAEFDGVDIVCEELSDRWEEALIIRDRVRQIWADL